MSYLNKQEGGSHYMQEIQPIEYIYKNKLGYIEGNVVKYITRHRTRMVLRIFARLYTTVSCC